MYKLFWFFGNFKDLCVKFQFLGFLSELVVALCIAWAMCYALSCVKTNQTISPHATHGKE